MPAMETPPDPLVADLIDAIRRRRKGAYISALERLVDHFAVTGQLPVPATVRKIGILAPQRAVGS